MMGLVPPPRPVSRDAFEKRWAEGKRSIEELDPDIFKWRRSNARLRMFQAITLCFGVVVLLGIVLLIMMRRVGIL